MTQTAKPKGPEPEVKKITLRAQWRQKRGRWMIVKKTDNGSGGWELYGSQKGSSTKEGAQRIIERLIMLEPEIYERG